MILSSYYISNPNKFTQDMQDNYYQDYMMKLPPKKDVYLKWLEGNIFNAFKQIATPMSAPL